MQLKRIDIKMGKKNYQVLEYMCKCNNNKYLLYTSYSIADELQCTFIVLLCNYYNNLLL